MIVNHKYSHFPTLIVNCMTPYGSQFQIFSIEQRETNFSLLTVFWISLSLSSFIQVSMLLWFNCNTGNIKNFFWLQLLYFLILYFSMILNSLHIASHSPTSLSGTSNLSSPSPLLQTPLSCLCPGTPAWLMPSPSTKLSLYSTQCSPGYSLFFQKWIVLPSPPTRTHFSCAQPVPGASSSKGLFRLRVSVFISILPFI